MVSRQYPNGKIADDDEGLIDVRIIADPKRQVVIVDFRKPVPWIALPKQEAVMLAKSLLEHANTLPEVPVVNTLAPKDSQ